MPPLLRSDLVEDRLYWIRYWYMQPGYTRDFYGERTDISRKVWVVNVARWQGEGWYEVGSDVLFGDWVPGFENVEVLEEVVEPAGAWPPAE